MNHNGNGNRACSEKHLSKCVDMSLMDRLSIEPGPPWLEARD